MVASDDWQAEGPHRDELRVGGGEKHTKYFYENEPSGRDSITDSTMHNSSACVSSLSTQMATSTGRALLPLSEAHSVHRTNGSNTDF